MHEHERVLDLRTGLLDRRLRWSAPSGAAVAVTSRRFVSLRRRELHAMRYEVRALSAAQVSLRPVAGCPHTPPPDVQPPEDWHSPPLEHEGCGHDPSGAWIAQRTRTTDIGVALTVAYRMEAPDGVEVSWTRDGEQVEVGARLEAGQALRLEVLTTYATAADTSTPQLQARARTALRSACGAGWARLEEEQGTMLAEVWRRADVVVEGDDEMQLALRFAVFHVVQASVCAAGSGIRAKGLTGTGYHGHAFWEADTFVLPLLTQALPAAAGDHLRWRHGMLGLAIDRARRLRLPGATFPWRTISGHECSGYWPAGTAAFHVNADIADAAVRYAATTRDEDFARDVGVDLVVHTARLWLGLGHHTADGSFRIDGMTGPDEYTALQDNNTYTNLMARRNLLAARDLSVRFPAEARRLGVDDDECRRWVRAAEAVVVPYDPVSAVTEQSENFTRHPPWDFDRAGSDGEPLSAHAPYVELYRRRVVKQADLVLALYLAGDSFTPEQKRQDFDYYEAVTVRDSSLSATAQAVVAAEVGHLELAWDYARETALIDLRDLHGSTDDGLHLAALAGTWTARRRFRRSARRGRCAAPRATPTPAAVPAAVRPLPRRHPSDRGRRGRPGHLPAGPRRGARRLAPWEGVQADGRRARRPAADRSGCSDHAADPAARSGAAAVGDPARRGGRIVVHNVADGCSARPGRLTAVSRLTVEGIAASVAPAPVEPARRATPPLTRHDGRRQPTAREDHYTHGHLARALLPPRRHLRRHRDQLRRLLRGRRPGRAVPARRLPS